MTTVDHGAAVAAETARFVSAVKDAEPTTPVPTCPEWTLADLVRHAGAAQRWMTLLLRQRIQERPTSRDVDLRLPEQVEGYPDWLAAGAAEAAELFAGFEPDEPMWVWGADQHARFWVRRMAFETLVHRVDAELALGIAPEIDRPLAVDGVDEFLVNLPYAFPFAPGTAKLRAEDRTLRFACTDGDEQWLVRLREDGFGLVTGEEALIPADATVHGLAAELLLLLYGRRERAAETFELLGDRQLVDHWFANSSF